MNNIDYFLEGDKLYRQIYRWQHKVAELRGIGDDGILHDRIEVVAKRLRENHNDPLWLEIQEYPTNLI